MNRRGFLSSILAAGIAPAIVRASSLMPIYTVKEPLIWLWGDGIHDDTLAMQAFCNGSPVKRVCDGQYIPVDHLHDGRYLITQTLTILGSKNILFENVYFSYEGPDDQTAFRVMPPNGVAWHGNDTWFKAQSALLESRGRDIILDQQLPQTPTCPS